MYLHGLQFFSEQRKLTRIGLAEAPLDDPLDWRMVSEEPLIDLGGEGATDSHMAAYPWVVRITDTHWHLYYAAWDGSFVPHAPHQKRYQTCMAESDDAGVTWRRDGRPLLALGRSGAPDENGTGSCAVIPVGERILDVLHGAVRADRRLGADLHRARRLARRRPHLRPARCGSAPEPPATYRPPRLHLLQAVRGALRRPLPHVVQLRRRWRALPNPLRAERRRHPLQVAPRPGGRRERIGLGLAR